MNGGAVATTVLTTSRIQWHAMAIGMVWGAVALLVSGAVAVALRRRRPGVLGLPLACAVLVALRSTAGHGSVPLAVVAAVALAFLGGLAAPRFARFGDWVHLAYLPGGAMLVAADVPGLSLGTRIAVGAGAAVCGAALADFDVRHRRDGLAVLLFAVTAASVMFLGKAGAAGPALFGVAVVFVIVLMPRPQAGLGAGGAAAAMVAYWWSVALIAADRGERITAAWVAVGFLLLEPLARRVIPSKLRPRAASARDRDSYLLVVATAAISQVLVVVYAVGVTDRVHGVDVAMLSALLVVLVGTPISTLVVPMPRNRRRHAETDDRSDYPGWGRTIG